MSRLRLILILLVLFSGCKGSARQEVTFNSQHISQVLDKMTDLMVNDVTNPPLAARFFSYACLAGYEVVSQHDTSCRSMYGVLNKYPRITRPDTITGYSYQLSAILAMMETARKMQPSGPAFEKFQQAFLDSCRRAGVSEELIGSSLSYARVVSKQILAYAKADNYNRISNYPRYTPSKEEGHWYPTPPAFFAPVEPYFNTVRPLTLDTCNQFKPAPPESFSKEKDSGFYRMLDANYRIGKNLTPKQRQIAAFWDCNPFALQSQGHLLTGMKKISPGAHWLGITGIACKKAGISFPQAMKINTMVAISLLDGFIACWDEKFRSNRIRPETAIRRYIDPEWKPFLQTPPFPEYLSGHSVISTAAAVVLTHYFGEDFHYTDTVEERFQLPARKFASFQQAAIEAGLSRFYGGIHFMDAIENGQQQGRQVGEWVLATFSRPVSTQAFPVSTQEFNKEKEVLLFAYFKGNGDGLHLAYSTDGYQWAALKNDQIFLKPTAGKDKLMRDPCIIRGADNKFHLVWTVSWNEQGLGYASSDDLITWTKQQFIPVMAHAPEARNTWAPEITYDARTRKYMIYWATTIRGLYPETQSAAEEAYNHRLYYTTTPDFKTFSPTKLLYEPGFNVIDATIIPHKKEFIMLLKDETTEPVQKNLRVARAPSLTGPYSKPGPPITGKYWAEGPTAFKMDGKWMVYFDKYTEHAMGAVQSADLVNWTDISGRISFPPGMRHGTIFQVTKKEFARLQ